MPFCCLKQHKNPLGQVWCTQCPSLVAGALIGDYEIASHLGQGTMSAVYLAQQRKLNRKVVIKVLHSVASQESINDFRTEAKVLASLSHPYILPIYDYDIIKAAHKDSLGNDSYSPYLVLRYAEQGSLDEMFKQEGSRPWSLQRVLPIIKEAAEALDYAHSQTTRGVLHRDIKPANILMVGAHIMLADFGVASLIDVDQSHTEAPWAGSPAYMAPEVWLYKPGRYSDQYALAVTCFRLLTGEYPWNIPPGGTTQQWMRLHQTVMPHFLHTFRPDLPMEVGSVLQKALAKEPHARYPTVSAFAADLRKAAQDETQPLGPPPRPIRPVHPPVEALPSAVPASQRQPMQVQVSAPPPVIVSGSIHPTPEASQQSDEDPIGKNPTTESWIGEISQKLQRNRWTVSAFILNVVICVVLVAGGWFWHTAPVVAFSLWPALLVGPFVGRLFHRVPGSTYAWGVLWGMIFGIVNAFLSALACGVWKVLFDVISQGQAGLGFQVTAIKLLPQLAVPLIVGLWLSVCGGAIIGLLAARRANAVPSAHQL